MAGRIAQERALELRAMKYETDDEFRRQLANALEQFGIEARLDEQRNYNAVTPATGQERIAELQRQLEGSRKP